MLSDKKFYLLFFVIITMTGFAVAMQSKNWINFFITIFALFIFLFILSGIYVIFSLFSANGKNIKKLIGW